MKVVCIGGEPAGLYFGLLMKLQDRDMQWPAACRAGKEAFERTLMRTGL